MYRLIYKDPFFTEFIDTLTFHKPIRTYNPDEYDLVPKKGVIERKISELEDQIIRTESQKALESEGWDNRIKNLQNQIEELKKKL